MKRERRNVTGGLSETAWCVLNDEEPPEDSDSWEAFELSYPTVHHQSKLALWLANRVPVLEAFIAKNPGRRPSWWWLFDPECPRVSAEDIERYEWQGCYWLDYTPDLRLRVGGVGDPRFLHLNYTPEFHRGVPCDWMTEEDVELYKVGVAMDPANPPAFESEAAYLKRHGLLTPVEERWLERHPEALEPETIEVNDTEEN